MTDLIGPQLGGVSFTGQRIDDRGRGLHSGRACARYAHRSAEISLVVASFKTACGQMAQRIGDVFANSRFVEVCVEAVELSHLSFAAGLSHSSRAHHQSECIEGHLSTVTVGVGHAPRSEYAIVDFRTQCVCQSHHGPGPALGREYRSRRRWSYCRMDRQIAAGDRNVDVLLRYF